MIRINKDKRIGNVVYIVEGAKKEFSLLTKIFKDLFGFSVVQFKRNNSPCYKYYNKYSESTVFIINTETSNISSIDNGQDYINEKFLWLYNEFQIDIHDCRVFYLFDRDYKSNVNTSLIQSLLSLLKSSTNNDTEQPGLLLINYPSIESFLIHAFENPIIFDESPNGSQLKSYINEKNYQQNNLQLKDIEVATKQILDVLKTKFSYTLNSKDLDDFGTNNIKIFTQQEQHLNQTKKYILLPLIVLSLIDLALITIEE